MRASFCTYKPSVTKLEFGTDYSSLPMCSQLLCWSQRLHHLARGRFTSKQKGYRDSIQPIHMYYSCRGASPKLSLLLAEQKAAFLYLLMRYFSRMTLPFSCIYFCFHSKAKYLETTTSVSRPYSIILSFISAIFPTKQEYFSHHGISHRQRIRYFIPYV